MMIPPSLPDDDIVVSRLLDGRGRAADWRRLREVVTADGAAWERVIGAAGDQDSLGAAMAGVGAQADGTDLSGALCTHEPEGTLRMVRHAADGRRSDRAARSARLGWLVAVCMALGMVSVVLRPKDMQHSPLSTAGPNFDALTASDFMNGYKDRASRDGTLVAEMPQRVVLESRPSADGKGHEVLYLRQFIERTVVDDLYKFGIDESGRPVMVPASLQKPRAAGAM